MSLPTEEHVHHFVPKRIGTDIRGEGKYILVCDCSKSLSEFAKESS